MAVKKKSTKAKKANPQGRPRRKNAVAKKRAAQSARAVAPAVKPAVGQIERATAKSSIPHFAWKREHYRTLQEFWPFYLYEHSFAVNRWLHFVGSSVGLVLVFLALATANYWLLFAALVSGYAFAWIGHFGVEKNRPATFKYPVKSFISDWRMWYCMLSGKIAAELKKYGITSR